MKKRRTFTPLSIKEKYIIHPLMKHCRNIHGKF